MTPPAATKSPRGRKSPNLVSLETTQQNLSMIAVLSVRWNEIPISELAEILRVSPYLRERYEIEVRKPFRHEVKQALASQPVEK